MRPQDVYGQTVATGADRVEEPADEHGPGCGGDGECKGGDGGEAPAIGDAIEKVPTEGATFRGPPGAPITIVEFADYECPFCARAESIVHAVEQAHAGQVRFVFKNLPLPFHTHARLMARAAVAADAQGRFWEMHDRLYTLAAPVERAALDQAAQSLGLDLARFDRDFDDASLDARIEADWPTPRPWASRAPRRSSSTATAWWERSPRACSRKPSPRAPLVDAEGAGAKQPRPAEAYFERNR